MEKVPSEMFSGTPFKICEKSGLELIHSGFKEFVRLFPRFGEAAPVYGLGDFQFWLALKRLSNAREPLLDLTKLPAANGRLDSDKLRQIAFEITKKGEAVLKGEADFVAVNGIDLWLGGVHLSEHNPLWRWDDGKQNLINADRPSNLSRVGEQQ